MSRRLKGLGVTLVVLFALGATVAQGASATIHEIELEGGHERAVLTGATHVGKSKLTVNTIVGPLGVECTGIYAATVKNGAKAMTIHPSYTNCEFAENPATIVFNHCAYVLEEKETNGSGDAPLEIECETGSKIEVNTPLIGCTLKFGAQTPASGVHYTNVQTAGKPMEVTLHVTATGLTYEKNCSFVIGTTGARLDDTATLNAWEDDGTQPEGTERTTPTYTEGAQTGVTMNPGV